MPTVLKRRPLTTRVPDADPDQLLTPREVASLLRVGRSKAYELLATGTIEGIRVGSSIRVTRRALREYIAKAPRVVDRYT